MLIYHHQWLRCGIIVSCICRCFNIRIRQSSYKPTIKILLKGLGLKAGNPVLLKLANASVPFLILTIQYCVLISLSASVAVISYARVIYICSYFSSSNRSSSGIQRICCHISRNPIFVIGLSWSITTRNPTSFSCFSQQ